MKAGNGQIQAMLTPSSLPAIVFAYTIVIVGGAVVPGPTEQLDPLDLDPKVLESYLRCLKGNPTPLGNSALATLPSIAATIRHRRLADNASIRGYYVARRIRDLVIEQYEAAAAQTAEELAWTVVYGRFVRGYTQRELKAIHNIPPRTATRYKLLGITLFGDALLTLWETDQDQASASAAPGT